MLQYLLGFLLCPYILVMFNYLCDYAAIKHREVSSIIIRYLLMYVVVFSIGAQCIVGLYYVISMIKLSLLIGGTL